MTLELFQWPHGGGVVEVDHGASEEAEKVEAAPLGSLVSKQSIPALPHPH